MKRIMIANRLNDAIANERVLIISNNVLSKTNNNGKTILSYIDKIPPQNVRQLYFSSEIPQVFGYSFFRLSDTDVLKGKFAPSKRGKALKKENGEVADDNINKYHKEYSTWMRLGRELLWLWSWKSKQLIQWLDEFLPTVVFFVAGDCVFAYDIYRYIVGKYNVKSAVYLTDDYIMPRAKDSNIDKFRRSLIKRNMRKAIKISDNFFTISTQMQDTYYRIFDRKSEILVNMTECLKRDNIAPSERYTFIYAGSLYYGRDIMLRKLVEALELYNKKGEKKQAILKIYSNNMPSNESLQHLNKKGISDFCGKIDYEQLIIEYNKANVLVFVESYDESCIEKTKYSFSTKIPEYLSLGKPILAIGPREVSSMDFLKECSLCVYPEGNINRCVEKLIDDEQYCNMLSNKASDLYLAKLDKRILQKDFLQKLFLLP